MSALKAGERPTMSQVLHTSCEALNELDNIKHDYAVVSAQRNELLEALRTTEANIRSLIASSNARDIYEPWLAVVQSAIAKTEGRQP